VAKAQTANKKRTPVRPPTITPKEIESRTKAAVKLIRIHKAKIKQLDDEVRDLEERVQLAIEESLPLWVGFAEVGSGYRYMSRCWIANQGWSPHSVHLILHPVCAAVRNRPLRRMMKLSLMCEVFECSSR